MKHLPLQPNYIQDYITKQILNEQKKMTEILEGRKRITDLTDVDIIDDFKNITHQNIIEVCNTMADSILTRCLIEAIVDMRDEYNHDFQSIIT